MAKELLFVVFFCKVLNMKKTCDRLAITISEFISILGFSEKICFLIFSLNQAVT